MNLPPKLAKKCLELAGQPTPGRARAASPTGRRRLTVEVEVLVRTVSESNAGGRLSAKVARKTAVKDAIRDALPLLDERFPLPVRVTLTRVSPGRLDDDNLRGALKAVRDVVASWLHLDDADKRVRWVYRQRPGWTGAVMIRVEHVTEEH